MNRPILAVALFAAASAVLGAQQTTQPNPYSGVSTPPPDDTIVVTVDQPAKPPAGHPMAATAATAPRPAAAVGEPQYGAGSASATTTVPAMQGQWQPGDGTDDGIVKVMPPVVAVHPALQQREYAPDPDGGIVHVASLGPGELRAGTEIRVQLMGDLSSSMSEAGAPFRCRVATDVLQDGQILIPAGSEIDGRVEEASMGGFGGHGELLLRPEKVTLPNGTSYALHAMVVDAPDSNTTVGAEGVIRPGSRLKRNGIEYGGAVGAGAVAGAFLGGPVGALAGGAVGAGVVTTHLLVSHPQTHLNAGTHLILTLTQRMHLEPSAADGD
ncbi:MAG TPA: hypothetical protein VMV57_13135 [Terracidiphilus sp.]|nr:hypothetical protein [Terracidiphilus sp.]